MRTNYTDKYSENGDRIYNIKYTNRIHTREYTIYMNYTDCAKSDFTLLKINHAKNKIRYKRLVNWKRKRKLKFCSFYLNIISFKYLPLLFRHKRII